MDTNHSPEVETDTWAQRRNALLDDMAEAMAGHWTLRYRRLPVARLRMLADFLLTEVLEREEAEGNDRG